MKTAGGLVAVRLSIPVEMESPCADCKDKAREAALHQA
jgi:hypothetical protein